ncbi:hypothetical protein LTS18_015107, partial [Coniosporium uncinatum]
AKTKVTAEQKEAEIASSKELQDRGLDCPLDKRLFVDPMKTPCCGKTYCNDCIENALVNSDLVCPNCSEPCFIDNLVPDDDMAKKVKTYEDEKTAERKAKERSTSPKPTTLPAQSGDKLGDGEKKGAQVQSPTPPRSSPTTPETKAATPTGSDSSKKRKAEDELPNERIPSAPKAMREAAAAHQQPQPQPPVTVPTNMTDFVATMNSLAQTNGMPNVTPQGNFGFGGGFNMSGIGGFPNQYAMPNMMNGMMNPMMNPMLGMQNGGWNNMSYQQQNGMYPNQQNWNMPNGYNNQNYSQQNWNQQQQDGRGWQGNNNSNQNQGWNNQQQGGNVPQGPKGGFPNQQRTVFSAPLPNEEESPYMRQPINPGRHQNKGRHQRPSDYTNLT